MNDHPFSIVVFVEDIIAVCESRPWSQAHALYNKLEAHGTLVDGYERYRSVNTAYLAGI